MMKAALSLGCVLVAAGVGGVLAGATRREGEVWSRQQEDAWHKEMGYQREVPFAPLPLASLALRPLHCRMQSDLRVRALGAA
eukprot:COSAG02_NODE_44963_length_361_cov_0.988550_2_plen_82_part_01